jgi:hypothetical protein
MSKGTTQAHHARCVRTKAKQKMNQALKAPGFGFPENKAVSAIRNGPLNRTENPVHIKYL